MNADLHQRKPSLDGLRGIAFLLVFLHHGIGSLPNSPNWMEPILVLKSAGWMGVDLFFVLSGFLITGILIQARTKPHYFRNFYMRRTLRIFPLYYATLICLGLLTPLLNFQWKAQHWSLPFYCANVAFGFDKSLAQLSPQISLAHIWSLCVEEQFYLLWPVVVWKWGGSRKQLVSILLVIIIFALVIRILICTLTIPDIAYALNYRLLPTRMDSVALGSCVAIFYSGKERALCLRASKVIWPVSISAILIMLFAVSPNHASMWVASWGFLLVGIASASLMCQALTKGSLWERVGQLKVLGFFGRYSYGMYIYHVFVLGGVGELQPWVNEMFQSRVIREIVMLTIRLGATTAIAFASYKWLERPFVRFKNRFEY